MLFGGDRLGVGDGLGGGYRHGDGRVVGGDGLRDRLRCRRRIGGDRLHDQPLFGRHGLVHGSRSRRRRRGSALLVGVQFCIDVLAGPEPPQEGSRLRRGPGADIRGLSRCRGVRCRPCRRRRRESSDDGLGCTSLAAADFAAAVGSTSTGSITPPAAASVRTWNVAPAAMTVPGPAECPFEPFVAWTTAGPVTPA